MSIGAPRAFWGLNSLADHPRDLRYVSVHYDAELRTVWCRMNPDAPTYFTAPLLDDLFTIKALLEAGSLTGDGPPAAFQVMRSDIPGIYGLGGDLLLFVRLIRERNRAELLAYAKRCVELVSALSTGYGQGIYSIALVQGAAFGGAFEAALSCQHIIAEQSAVFGFPELLFNLFPGMGAIHALRRRVPHAHAMKLIESAKTYTATELVEAGVIDVVVGDGEGLLAVDGFLRGKLRRVSGVQALQKVGTLIAAPSVAELLETVELWVDAALHLSEANLATMLRIASAQERKHSTLCHVA